MGWQVMFADFSSCGAHVNADAHSWLTFATDRREHIAHRLCTDAPFAL